jgi:hypothetical protein
MKMLVIVQGRARFGLDAEFAEPAIREAIEDGCNDVASQVIDYTDSERSDIDRDEYVTVTEDDGAVLWQGWLDSSKRDDPPPVDRDALGQLAVKWKAEADDAKPDVNDPDSPHAAARRATVRQKRICCRQLLDALGVPLLGAIAGAE